MASELGTQASSGTDAGTTENIEVRRVERLIEALSGISMGNFAAVDIAPGPPEQTFTMLETVLKQLLSDLGEVLEANERFVQELQNGHRDMQDKLETIERQQLAIRDLSTPIIEVWDDVVTLPVVGLVDSRRAADMTQRLLYAIVERRARCVIVDLTGVDLVDTMTADHLVKMLQAASMLGAFCVVSGIMPDVAQTLARLGVELAGVKTVRSLKEGLAASVRFLQEQRDAL